MAHRLLILIANADPSRPMTLSFPLRQAISAAHMEYDVEVVFGSPLVDFIRLGSALLTQTCGESQETLHDLIQTAHDVGVNFKACLPVNLSLTPKQLIGEVREVVGSAYIVSEIMAPDTCILSY